MTEAEQAANNAWSRNNNLIWLINNMPNDRKRILFGVNCLRRVQHLTTCQESINIINEVEEYVDGNGEAIQGWIITEEHNHNIAWALWHLQESIGSPLRCCDVADSITGNEDTGEALEQIKILKDIYLPNIPTIYTTPTIVQLANDIYNSQDYRYLPVLHDMLLDVGNDILVLEHCMQQVHYKGCWLVDSILNQTA